MAKAASVDDLVLEAVERAVADPLPRPLHGTRANPGVFLSKSATAKAAAQRCLDSGLIEKRAAQKTKSKTVELYGVAPAGIAYLLEHDQPTRLLQAASGGVDNLAQVAGRCQQTLEQVQRQLGELRQTVAGAAARLQPPEFDRFLKALQRPAAGGDQPSPPQASSSAKADVGQADAELAANLLAHVRQQKQQAALRPVELPQLYRFARSLRPDLSLGQFHDVLRHMAAARQIRLSPFTQAMYQLAEPECAMILGREVMYYVDGM